MKIVFSHSVVVVTLPARATFHLTRACDDSIRESLHALDPDHGVGGLREHKVDDGASRPSLRRRHDTGGDQTMRAVFCDVTYYSSIASALQVRQLN